MASSSVAGESSKDPWAPTFSNRPQDYREWRARIHLYFKKMQLQKKPAEGIIKILTTTTGAAWKQVEPQADALSEDKEGFTKLIAILDRAFKYDDRVEQPRAFKKFFYSLSRRPDQILTLMSFCADHRAEVSGWLLLRPAGGVVCRRSRNNWCNHNVVQHWRKRKLKRPCTFCLEKISVAVLRMTVEASPTTLLTPQERAPTSGRRRAPKRHTMPLMRNLTSTIYEEFYEVKDAETYQGDWPEAPEEILYI